MRKEFIGLGVLSMVILAGCGSNTESKEVETTAEQKLIEDELGREVEIPNEIDQVVMGSILPYFSTWFVATNSTDEIAGMHPNSYNAATNSILEEISPAVADANTSFVKNGEVNVETLMQLNPDVYFERANEEMSVQKVEETGIPTVTLDTATKTDNPLDNFERWVSITGEITGTSDRPDQIIEEGRQAQAEVDEGLEGVSEEEKPSVMLLQYHSENEISIGGVNHHGNRWINATGGRDVAEGDINGIKEVNMEQVYNWDPDIIYITNFTETQPEDLYENVFRGQDWSDVTAVQEQQVYKIPLGIYRWMPPSGDAPLMLKWMAQKNHPEQFDYSIEEEIKAYYDEFYDYDISDEQIHDVLNPSSEAAKY
ncbi:ABC transporter substrate-binding protein [Bacillaceae bacterium JMAK1]|nr:ABC transporter substrate-binding protein [Bacillaceae bacterium JMAK1]